MEVELENKKTKNDERREFEDKEKWVFDGSLDHRGNVPLRASTGVWRASLFVMAIELCEKMTYYAISANLISYLTKVLHQDLNTAARNVNYWIGVTTIIPLIGGYLADAYTGRFIMILCSSLVYLAGLMLLTMSEFIPSLKPCNNVKGCGHPRKVHEIVFFMAIYLLSLGSGGHKPCLASFGADQFDDYHLNERKKKMSFFNWWNFILCTGLLLGATLFVYLQDHVGWGIASLSLTILLGVAFILFYLGKRFYRYRIPEGSIFTPILQVLVAAITKRNLPLPSAPNLLYEIPKSENRGRFLAHTNNLRFLDKAAIVEGYNIRDSELQQISWKLTTITMVEETKLIIRMIPIWFTSLIFGICWAVHTTFFVKQSYSMNRKVGRSFEIPAAAVSCISPIGMLLALLLYEKLLIPILRRARGNERGLNILQRIGVGMIFPIVTMSIAALVEKKRLRIAKNEIARGGTPETEAFPMSVLWLVPQCVILGVGDAFFLVGLQEYFYEQVPDAMRSIGIGLYLTVIGAGSFINSFLITIVGHITGKWGTSWFGKDLNSSRLDKFYWLVAAISCFNFCAYLFLARRYSYKTVVNKNVFTDHSSEGDDIKTLPISSD